MFRHRTALFVAGTLLAAAFLYGLFQLFALRYAAGDVHPLYSTLRADPLGARALYDALEEIPGINVARNFRPLEKLEPAAGSTLYLLGSGGKSLDPKEWRELLKGISTPHFEAMIAGGTRVVLTLLPSPQWAGDAKASDERQQKIRRWMGDRNPPEEPNKKTPDTGSEKPERPGHWGVTVARFDRPKGSGSTLDAIASPDFAGEPRLSWHSALYFDQLDPGWRILYRCLGKPVMIEHSLGLGSVVLSADSYFAGNEALRAERSPRLLAWLQGPHRHALFDETHLGVVEQSGITTLARKYRLHGLALALLILAALFLWQNLTSFVPVFTDPEAADFVRGKEASAGFVNLLRRTIPTREIIPTCWQEWRRSFAHRPAREDAGRIARAAQIAIGDSTHPVEAYRQISQILSRPK